MDLEIVSFRKSLELTILRLDYRRKLKETILRQVNLERIKQEEVLNEILARLNRKTLQSLLSMKLTFSNFRVGEEVKK